MKLFKDVYVYLPTNLKRILANIEAIRRDYYRQTDSIGYDIINNLLSYDSHNTLLKFNDLIEYTNKHVPYYKANRMKKIYKLDDITKLPILKKDVIRKNSRELISIEAKIKKDLWNGSTSGSTGSPLKFYKDRESLKYERNSYNEFYRYLGGNEDENKVRFSGINIVPYSHSKPPYYLYIDKYKQLQCSVYHINQNSYHHYLEEFDKKNVKYGTGFPSAWTALAEIMLENGVTYDGLKVIITDSEGLSEKNKNIIEKAFNCKVYRTYGLGEVGMCAIECEHGVYHSLPTHYIEIADENGNRQEEGVQGEILVTDFNSKFSPYIRYSTGDLGIMRQSFCECGFKTPQITKIVGRVEDYILTKDGRKITRVSKPLSYAKGVKQSQIIQESLEEITLKIIPGNNFKEESIVKVIKELKKLIGNIKVNWELVNELEKTSNGKIKFLIRKI